MATIRDVANLSGVSVSTVSIVINGRQAERGIPDSTVRRVLDAVEQLGYRPNRAARTLRGMPERPVIALFWVLDRRSTFFMRLVRGIEETLSARGCDLVVHPYSNGRLCEAKRYLTSGDYAGILIGALSEDDADYLTTLAISTPLVVINLSMPGFACCFTDIGQIGRMAAGFAARRGCRTLAVAADRAAVVPKTTRRESVVAACESSGIPCIAKASEDNSIPGGMRAADALLAASPRPDMIYADNDIIALGVSIACQMAGVKDMVILSVCLNHTGIGENLSPAISLIDIPGETLGREGARMLLEWISTGVRCENMCIPCGLIER